MKGGIPILFGIIGVLLISGCISNNMYTQENCVRDMPLGDGSDCRFIQPDGSVLWCPDDDGDCSDIGDGLT
jgi:hypothetical protein